MRIALVRQRYQVGGGAERSLESLMAELVRRGHEVYLVANQWGGAKLDGVTFHRVPIIGGLSFLKVLSFSTFSFLQLRKMDFDVVHSFERLFSADLYRAGDGCHREWLFQRRRIEPFFQWTLHWVNPLHRTLLALERRIFIGGGARLIVANSQRGKEEIIRHYGTPPEKIEVLYNGVDLARFRPEDRQPLRRQVRREWRINDREILILFIGSGFKRKGLRFLVEALALLTRRPAGPKVRLLVVGKGDPTPYQRLAQRLGIKDRVLFADPVESPHGFYAAADLFALPTLYDPFSNASLEAMAAELPVITSRMNGACELLEGGGGGALLQDPLDPEELASHLLSFFDRDAREIAGKEAAAIAQSFRIDEHVKKVLGLYEALLEGGRGW